ncbi:MAG: cation:proton antiporter [Myxococcota bacterium]
MSVATRFGLGSVLGYLIAGIALSPVLRALHVDVGALQVFAEFGVVMMLFLIGLELQPKKLWEMRRKLIGLGGGQVVATTAVIGGIAFFFNGRPWQTALAIGLVLTLSSTAIVLQSLAEKGLLRSEGGESSFSVLLIQDVSIIPILATLPLLAAPGLTASASSDHGGHHHDTINITEGMPDWLAGLTTLGAIVAVIVVGAYLVPIMFRFIAKGRLRELFTAAALAVVIGVALLMTFVGLSPALGTFLAGVMLANSEYRHEFESDIEPFKGLLLGLFFITVGANIDFGLAQARLGEVVFWALTTMVVKGAVLYVVGRLSGLRNQALWLFVLALPQAGEFAFVLIAFGVANMVFDDSLAKLLLLIVALTMLLTPLLFLFYDRVIARRYNTKEPKEADAIDEESPIIIAGRGRVGGLVDRILQVAGYSTTVIDYDSSHLEIVRKFGFRVYFGDATRPDLLKAAGIERARLLVVALDEREQIDRLVKHALKHYPNLHVTARALDRNHVFELWSYGCRDIIRETYDSSMRMGRSALEALDIDRETAQSMVDAFETMDRASMPEIADLYDMDVPYHQNDALIAKVKEWRQKWDPILREQMDELLEGER